MKKQFDRRTFLQLTAAGGAVLLAPQNIITFAAANKSSKIISPGCRKSKVKVARLYMANPENPWSLWPKPDLNLKKEMKFYQAQFDKMQDELYDVDFVADELITSPQQVAKLKNKLKDVDGILAIHLLMGIYEILTEILKLGHPTMVFAAPYSGHGWTTFGSLRQQELGKKMDCILTSDYSQLALAIRPFRAIHHLKEAKILNLADRTPGSYEENIKQKFGTEIKQIQLDRMLKVYNSISDTDAEAETQKWITQAEKVVEPPRDEIFKSCKLALAFEKLLDEENATVMTVDCYGSMYRKLPAFPCVGFTRLNDLGLGGICESDLRSAMTHIIIQGLCGKPGFISDPTVDEGTDSIILAHCLGTTKMDGPDKPAAPYKIRTIMERQEGAVPQVQMRIGQKVTQAILIDTDLVRYFTGQITEALVSPEHDRGCRTKIAVKPDGCLRKLWQNWAHGLHRQTCYGDITEELGYFCKFMEIKLVDESA